MCGIRLYKQENAHRVTSVLQVRKLRLKEVTFKVAQLKCSHGVSILLLFLSLITHCLLLGLEFQFYAHSTPPVMPGWKGANDIRRFISFTLARRQDCLLSRRQTDCSSGDKWNDLNWSLSWWLASPLPLSSGLQPRWFFSFDVPWVISSEAEEPGNTSKGLRLDGTWWSWGLDIIGSCSSICYRKVTI